MQIRQNEFQENFGRVTVEGARQQNLLLREPELAQYHMAKIAADEAALSMQRPNPAPALGGKIVDPNSRRFHGKGLGREGWVQKTQKIGLKEESLATQEENLGRIVDIVI